MSGLDQARAWLLRPVRPERLALLRILVSAYGLVWLVVRAPHLRDVARLPEGRWDPVGVLAPLDGPPPSGLMAALVVVAILSGGATLVGWRFRLTGPVFALTLLVVTTWRNCWGQIFHTENLLVLHALVLALAPAAAAWALDSNRGLDVRRGGDGKRRGRPEPGPAAGAAVRVMALRTVSTYVVAGVAKLRYGGLAWLDGDVLLHQVAFDNLRKAVVGDPFSPLADLLVGARWLFVPFAVATLAVELGAPLALLSARAARVWSATAWVFHLGVLVTMVILFAYPLTGVALAPVLLFHGDGVPLPRVRAWVRNRRSAAPRARSLAG